MLGGISVVLYAVMPRICVVCARPDRDKIEEIAFEKGPRETARIVGIWHSSISRHMKGHLGRQVTSVEPGEGEERDAAIEDLDAVPAVLNIPPAKHAAKEAKKAAPAERGGIYKARFPKIAAIVGHADRKRYLARLFSKGQFHGLRTSEHLARIWDNLDLPAFAELVSQAAGEADFRRGSVQARKLAILGKVQTVLDQAIEAKDIKTAAALLKTWAQLDGVVNDIDPITALASQPYWRLATQVLQKYPAALSEIHETLLAAEAQKRAALAPVLVQPVQVEPKE